MGIIPLSYHRIEVEMMSLSSARENHTLHAGLVLPLPLVTPSESWLPVIPCTIAENHNCRWCFWETITIDTEGRAHLTSRPSCSTKALISLHMNLRSHFTPLPHPILCSGHSSDSTDLGWACWPHRNPLTWHWAPVHAIHKHSEIFP